MRKPNRVEDSVEAISHIAWVGEVSVLVRDERLVFSEIHFHAQAVYHFYRRIVERYVSLARFAFQFADFNFEFGDVIQTISDVHFLYATL